MSKLSKILITVFLTIFVSAVFIVFQFFDFGKNKNRVLAIEAQELGVEDPAAYICPKARSLEEITPFCPGIIIIHMGETVNGLTLTTTEYEGREYYAVIGFKNGGGGEFGLVEENIKNLNDYIQNLPDTAFKNNPSQRKNSLINKVKEVYLKIENQEYLEAINKLQDDIYAKLDEDKTATDWVIDSESQQVIFGYINNLVNYLKGLL